MVDSKVVAARTDAGMLALWSPGAFTGVHDYATWESRLGGRVSEAIRAGEFVPLNVGADGAWGVRVAVDPDGLTDRERQYLVVTSEPYLLVHQGDQIHISGIEQIGNANTPGIALDAGRYGVRVSLIAWGDEPGARMPDGSPTASALADFVVFIGPVSDSSFRVDERTFGPPGP